MFSNILSSSNKALWHPPDLCGTLLKQARKHGGWKERHFVLRGSVLFWFSSSAASKPRAFVPLEGASVHAVQPTPAFDGSSTVHGIVVLLDDAYALSPGGRSELVLSATTPELQALWVEALTQACIPRPELLARLHDATAWSNSAYALEPGTPDAYEQHLRAHSASRRSSSSLGTPTTWQGGGTPTPWLGPGAGYQASAAAPSVGSNASSLLATPRQPSTSGSALYQGGNPYGSAQWQAPDAPSVDVHLPAGTSSYALPLPHLGAAPGSAPRALAAPSSASTRHAVPPPGSSGLWDEAPLPASRRAPGSRDSALESVAQVQRQITLAADLLARHAQRLQQRADGAPAQPPPGDGGDDDDTFSFASAPAPAASDPLPAAPRASTAAQPPPWLRSALGNLQSSLDKVRTSMAELQAAPSPPPAEQQASVLSAARPMLGSIGAARSVPASSAALSSSSSYGPAGLGEWDFSGHTALAAALQHLRSCAQLLHAQEPGVLAPGGIPKAQDFTLELDGVLAELSRLQRHARRGSALGAAPRTMSFGGAPAAPSLAGRSALDPQGATRLSAAAAVPQPSLLDSFGGGGASGLHAPKGGGASVLGAGSVGGARSWSIGVPPSSSWRSPSFAGLGGQGSVLGSDAGGASLLAPRSRSVKSASVPPSSSFTGARASTAWGQEAEAVADVQRGPSHLRSTLGGGGGGSIAMPSRSRAASRASAAQPDGAPRASAARRSTAALRGSVGAAAAGGAPSWALHGSQWQLEEGDGGAGVDEGAQAGWELEGQVELRDEEDEEEAEVFDELQPEGGEEEEAFELSGHAAPRRSSQHHVEGRLSDVQWGRASQRLSSSHLHGDAGLAPAGGRASSLAHQEPLPSLRQSYASRTPSALAAGRSGAQGLSRWEQQDDAYEEEGQLELEGAEGGWGGFSASSPVPPTPSARSSGTARWQPPPQQQRLSTSAKLSTGYVL